MVDPLRDSWYAFVAQLLVLDPVRGIATLKRIDHVEPDARVAALIDAIAQIKEPRSVQSIAVQLKHSTLPELASVGRHVEVQLGKSRRAVAVSTS